MNPHLMELEGKSKWQLGFPALRASSRSLTMPRPTTPLVYVSGTTRNSAGAALGSCVLEMFRTFDDSKVQVTISDSAGRYVFPLPVNNGNGPYYVVAYKAGTVDVAGTSANVLLGSVPSGITMYSTNFTLTENPISESGAWVNRSSQGTVVQSTPGNAHGTMVSFDGTNYIDSAACLANWFGSNYSVQATLLNNSAVTGLEAELLLRTDLTPSSSTAYEIDLFIGGGSVSVVRWNGPNNSFTLDSGSPYTTNVVLTDGAVWAASIVGNLINVTCNGNPVVTNLDITTAFGGGLVLVSGAPGIGFWNQTGSVPNQLLLGWKNFAASPL